MDTTSTVTAVADEKKHRRRYLTLVVLSISLIVIALDVTVLNVAIPTLQRELGASASGLQWIINAYILVFAGLLLTMGSLGDRFGRLRALQAGLVVFGLASLAAAYSQTTGQLIAARAAQGIGGAMIMPSTLSVIVDVFPREERAKAIGIWAGVAALGIPLGMIVGGWLLENFWWGTAFLINVPVVIVALVGGWVFVPESRDPEARRIDIPGAAISMLGLAALIYTIIEAPERGWAAPLTLAGFALTGVAGVVFVLYELRTKESMLDVRYFANSRLSAGAGSIGIAFMLMLGTMFLLTQYLQFVQGYSPLDTGIRLVPMAFGFMLGAPVSARLVSLLGTKWTVAGGLLIIAGSVGSMAMLDTTTAYWVVGSLLLLFGIGGANTMAPATDAVMAALPESHAGVGSALNDTTRQVGGALGVGIFGSIFNSLYSSNVTSAVADLPAEAASLAKNSVGGAFQVAADLGEAGSGSLVQAANSSFVDATGIVFVIMGTIGFVGALLTIRFLPARDIGDDTVVATDPAPAGAALDPVPISGEDD